MKWISNAAFKKELTSGTIFKLKGTTDISIHTIHGLGNKFYITCYGLGLDAFGLNTDNFDLAVENAKVIVQEKLKLLNERYSNFLSDESVNELVRY